MASGTTGALGRFFSFFPFSLHSRCEIKRAGEKKKARFLQGFTGTGLESRMRTFRCFIFLCFQIQDCLKSDDGGTGILTKKNLPRDYVVCGGGNPRGYPERSGGGNPRGHLERSGGRRL